MSLVTLEEKSRRLSEVLSKDFCPWANRYVYWLKDPLAIMALAFASTVLCAIFLNPLVLGLSVLLVLIAAIGVAMPAIAIRGVSCRIVFDVTRSRVGQPAIVRLIVQNKYPIPVWGLSLIKGFSQDTSTDGREGVSLAKVAGWSTAEYSWPFTPIRRGLYPNMTPEIETRFPLGLFRAKKRITTDGQLTVWPSTVALSGMPDASESQHAEEHFSERRIGDFGDMMGTRPFRPGDSLRGVHWAQTARQQLMVVTERQAPAMSSIRVVVDLSEASHPKANRDQTIELAIAAAASICESVHRQHARIELILGKEIIVAAEGRSGIQRVMDRLAVAEAMAEEFRGNSRSNCFEILITTTAGNPNGHPHLVLVGEGDADSWLRIPDIDALKHDVPGFWGKACHVA